MKIDFHCHTLKTKNDESETRNVTLDLFKEKILLSEVKIIAITNHNLFDKEQYILFKENVKDTCQVWPGIELDVIGASGKKGHLILISNPEDVELFSQKMNELLNDSTTSRRLITRSRFCLDEVLSFLRRDYILLRTELHRLHAGTVLC